MSKPKFKIGEEVKHSSLSDPIVVVDVLKSTKTGQTVYQCNSKDSGSNVSFTYYAKESELLPKFKFELGDVALFTFNGGNIPVRIVSRRISLTSDHVYDVTHQDKLGVTWSAVVTEDKLASGLDSPTRP